MTTSSKDLEEEEYFNTIVLEPHPKLVTGQGRGFQVRCRYRKQEPANLPPVSMKIFKNNIQINGQDDGEELTNGTSAVDRSINIGDPLQIRIQVHANTT